MASGKTEAIAEQALSLLFNTQNLTEEKFIGIAKKVGRIATEITVEVKKLKAFKIDIHWKSRVINVPIAIDKIKALIDDLTKGLIEKLKGIEQPFKSFVSSLHAAKQEVDPLGGPQSVSKIVTTFSKLQDFITSLDILAGDVDRALDDVIQLQALFERVVDDIEHLEDVFLPQKSRRSKVTLTYFKRSA
jgi:hypothetical protein